MRVKLVGALAAMVIAATAGGAVSAHHSFAMFDRTRKETVRGTVGSFEWSNPHVFIGVDTPARKGPPKRYMIECGSISILSRNGWKISSIRVGDVITVQFYPLKDGQPGGLIDHVTTRDGTNLKQ